MSDCHKFGKVMKRPLHRSDYQKSVPGKYWRVISVLVVMISMGCAFVSAESLRIATEILEQLPDGRIRLQTGNTHHSERMMNTSIKKISASAGPDKIFSTEPHLKNAVTAPAGTGDASLKILIRGGGDESIKKFYPYNINVFNKENKFKFDGHGDHLDEDISWTVALPEGTYDICGTFVLIGEDAGKQRVVCIAHCDVEVAGNVEETIYLDEANHLIYMEQYLPSGKEVVLPKGTELDEAPWVEWDYTDATASEYTGFYSIFNPNAGEIFGAFIRADMESDFSYFGIWVNDMSENYHFTEEVTVDSMEGCCFIGESTPLSKEILNSEDFRLRNNPANYHAVEELPVHHSPSYADVPEDLRDKGWNVSAWTDTYDMGSMGITYAGDVEIKCQVCLPSNPKMNLALYQTAVDAAIKEEWSPEDDPYYSTMELLSLPKIMENGEWEFINANHAVKGGFSNFPEGTVIVDGNGIQVPQLPGHEIYSFAQKDCCMTLGNSCPIIDTRIGQDVVGVERDDDGNFIWVYGNVLETAYIGRIGEVHEDYPILTSVKINGEEMPLEENMDMYQWYSIRRSDLETIPGKVELTVTDTNVSVDDLQGRNVAKLVYDERNDDICLPSVSMLIFRDKNNMVTDRFDRPDDGLMYFSAGDFNWDTNWFVCGEIDVKVEYAPYGTENFKEIEVDEVPELFLMPNFGYCYRASLDQIDLPSDNGWYNLRLTVTDRAGNSQSQIIEPAFNIKKVSATEIIDGESTRYTVFSIDGFKVGELSSVSETGSLKEGIYLLRSKDGSQVKKVFIR